MPRTIKLTLLLRGHRRLSTWKCCNTATNHVGGLGRRTRQLQIPLLHHDVGTYISLHVRLGLILRIRAVQNSRARSTLKCYNVNLPRFLSHKNDQNAIKHFRSELQSSSGINMYNPHLLKTTLGREKTRKEDKKSISKSTCCCLEFRRYTLVNLVDSPPSPHPVLEKNKAWRADLCTLRETP